jgi:YidC/Oxa1 family membrane protein insertase
MKEIEPELAKLREKFPDRQTQGLKTLELYKEKGVNPFSSFFLLLIQLPVLIALYHVFVSSGLPAINPTYLYSFVTAPTIDMYFLGLLDISKASIIMSLLASVSQFLQLHYSLAAANVKMPTSSSNNANNVGNIAMNMNKQMKYIFPVIIFIFSYKISAVIALYWAVSSLFTLGQELFVRRKLAQGTSLN